MEDRLPSRNVILGGKRKLFKGHIRRKPWWNEKLATTWDKLEEAERQYRKAQSDRQKEMGKQRIKVLKKDFDRDVKAAKKNSGKPNKMNYISYVSQIAQIFGRGLVKLVVIIGKKRYPMKGRL